MRIDEILASGGPTFSFEFFPPKTPVGEQNLSAALAELRTLEPSFVSVTYGAGGSTRERTLEIVKQLKEEYGLEAMAHFTCVGATVDELRETLEETAWGFTPESLLGIYQWRSPRGHSTLRIAFTGSVQGHDAARPLDPPVVTTHWFAREEILQRATQLRTPLVLRCIDDWLAGRRLPLDALTAELSDPGLSVKAP